MAKRRVVFESALVVVLGVAVLGATLAVSQRGNDYAFFDELIDVKHIISQRFVDVPDDKALKEGAIRGMVEALNDPYTVYVPPADKRDFNKELTGEYVGIGALVNAQDGWLTIVSPLEDSPAFRSGLMADDRVAEIDGKTTQNLSMDACVDLLMGEPGTPVNLTVERKGERLNIEVIRNHIKTRSVKGFHRESGDPNNWEYLIDPVRKVGYIRLTQFTPGSAAELGAALRSMGAEKGELKGLVLDMRFNPGGLLNEAEAMADLFLESGVIVSTRGRAFQERVSKAEKAGTLPQFPLAVLLNGQSASASEVLAGALTENGRAIVVGSRSFGKGSVQVVLSVPSGKGSEIKITEQGYFLPSGRSISRKDDSAAWGVDPTEGFYVPMSDEEVGAMLEVRRREEILSAAKAGEGPAQLDGADPKAQASPEDWSDPEWILTALKDKQLSAAVRAVQAYADGGAWTPTGEKGIESGKIALSELQLSRQFRERLVRELIRTDKRIAAIETATGPDAATATKDLWADAIDVSGGTVEVKDKDGKVIAVLDVTGNDLERWLVDADVKKKGEE